MRSLKITMLRWPYVHLLVIQTYCYEMYDMNQGNKCTLIVWQNKVFVKYRSSARHTHPFVKTSSLKLSSNSTETQGRRSLN
jgi:hypothetical protein